MPERDEPPICIGHARQAQLHQTRSRCANHARDRLEHRMLCFLRTQVGQRWDDVLVRLDERLRDAPEGYALARDVRRSLLSVRDHLRPGGRTYRISGGHLSVEEGTGILCFLPIERKKHRRVVTYSASELRTSPGYVC